MCFFVVRGEYLEMIFDDIGTHPFHQTTDVDFELMGLAYDTKFDLSHE
ncbi:hypothetical protein [Photorhabdus bodei]|uniref:Uncharacterized protein n=1 Tax=Photorhabdus bodei TaxID=2029681 RepID=A0ABX0AXW6_9GAMM|nr:hypothetical protein [Photorhabdus bodei]NDL01383.1 hypothetical protein [Photorhabdus bodei]NDL05672.1 hypothetical protein [Photorhabdus bodei]NDL09828.1 hypothetical protein [Photorhabdus bodei]